MKALFDAITAWTHGTSKAVGDLLEPTPKFLFSTTSGTATIDRLPRARKKTELFVDYSYEPLRAEHLAFLAVLAGIPPDRRFQFQEHMRETYSTMFEASSSCVIKGGYAWCMPRGRKDMADSNPRRLISRDG